MDITLHLTEEQASRAEELARSFGVETNEFVRAAISEVLNGPSEKVKAAIQRILADDKELYRRLA